MYLPPSSPLRVIVMRMETSMVYEMELLIRGTEPSLKQIAHENQELFRTIYSITTPQDFNLLRYPHSPVFTERSLTPNHRPSPTWCCMYSFSNTKASSIPETPMPYPSNSYATTSSLVLSSLPSTPPAPHTHSATLPSITSRNYPSLMNARASIPLQIHRSRTSFH